MNAHIVPRQKKEWSSAHKNLGPSTASVDCQPLIPHKNQYSILMYISHCFLLGCAQLHVLYEYFLEDFIEEKENEKGKQREILRTDAFEDTWQLTESDSSLILVFGGVDRLSQ